MKTKTQKTSKNAAAPEKEPPPSPELQYCDYIASSGNYAVENRILHEWDGEIWKPIAPDDAENQALRWLSSEEHLQSRATPRLAASCAAAAAMLTPPIPRMQHENKIVLAVENGYLHIDLEKQKLELRTPEKGLGITYKLKCAFDENAEAPLFQRFLHSVLPDEKTRDFVQEYAGYTLLPDTRFQIGMWWLGNGSNGKSTLAEILAALHAKISTLTLDNLQGFHLASLIGASMVWVDETPKKIDEQRLKTLISGGVVQIDRKFRDPVNLKPVAKWIICGNDLPAISDQSHGFWRRFAIVDFPKAAKESEKDPLLPSKIIRHELSGVLNWVISGLLRLIQRGKFPEISQPMRERLESSQRETNNVLAWWQDERARFTNDKQSYTKKNGVYFDYRMYASSTGTLPVSEERFWSRLKQIVGKQNLIIEQRRKMHSVTRFVNLELTNPPEEST